MDYAVYFDGERVEHLKTLVEARKIAEKVQPPLKAKIWLKDERLVGGGSLIEVVTPEETDERGPSRSQR